MNNDEFLKRLSEVSEWCRPTITQADPRRGRRGRKSYEEIEWEENEEEALGEEIHMGPNETIPPMLTKIKHEVKNCEDCGRLCQGRRVEMRMCSYPRDHFRQHCKFCGLTKNPLTGKFDLKQGVELQNTFKKYWYNLEKK
jgi:hypothetical protein